MRKFMPDLEIVMSPLCQEISKDGASGSGCQKILEIVASNLFLVAMLTWINACL